MIRRAILIFFSLLLVTAPALSTDYQLKDLHGKVHRVSDYRGKFLIINFWATWCDPCIHEMPELEKFYQANRNDAMVWGVTFESTGRQRVIEFVKHLGVTYPILGFGQNPETGYGSVTVLPTTFVIDRKGLFLHKFEGPIIAADIEKVIADQ